MVLPCSLTYLYQCGVLGATSPTLTLKVLPSLVRLTRDDTEDILVRTEATTTLG